MSRVRIEGHDMMLFNDQGKSFAFGTNSSLSIETAMDEISDKDTSVYGTQSPGRITWSISSDHTMDLGTFYTLFDWQQNQNKAKVYYGVRSGFKGDTNTTWDPTSEVNNGTDGERTIDTYSYCLCGYVYLSSLSTTASDGDRANYSVTLTGAGPLEKVKFSAS